MPSQDLGISRVLLGGPRVALSENAEILNWELSKYNVQLQETF